jgi:hypothetical protein
VAVLGRAGAWNSAPPRTARADTHASSFIRGAW